jgi:hypothetical protein
MNGKLSGSVLATALGHAKPGVQVATPFKLALSPTLSLDREAAELELLLAAAAIVVHNCVAAAVAIGCVLLGWTGQSLSPPVCGGQVWQLPSVTLKNALPESGEYSQTADTKGRYSSCSTPIGRDRPWYHFWYGRYSTTWKATERRYVCLLSLVRVRVRASCNGRGAPADEPCAFPCLTWILGAARPAREADDAAIAAPDVVLLTARRGVGRRGAQCTSTRDDDGVRLFVVVPCLPRSLTN